MRDCTAGIVRLLMKFKTRRQALLFLFPRFRSREKPGSNSDWIFNSSVCNSSRFGRKKKKKKKL